MVLLCLCDGGTNALSERLVPRVALHLLRLSRLLEDLLLAHLLTSSIGLHDGLDQIAKALGVLGRLGNLGLLVTQRQA